MKISKNGINLIKEFESLKLKAYPDPGTGGKPWTIGYGHTKGVKLGDVISKQQAEQYLRDDLNEFESGVSRLVTVQINQNQFDALVSFAFNVGLGALEKSTLLRLLNAGDYAGAAEQFPRWNKAAGKVLNGLIRRRAAEQALFKS